MNLLDDGHKIFRPINMLVHALQRLTRDRLETDAPHRTAALGGEFEHAVVLREFGGNTSLPLDAASPQGTHDLFRTLRRTKKIGIIDRDRTRPAVLHLMNNFVDWTITE